VNYLIRQQLRRAIDRQAAAKVGTRWGFALRGKQAFDRGFTPADCPFALGTSAQHSWIAGWQAAFDKKFRNRRFR